MSDFEKLKGLELKGLLRAYNPPRIVEYGQVTDLTGSA